MTLLELKYVITSARNAADIAKGMIKLRSIVFNSREEEERWRQGPKCLVDRWFGRLGDSSPKVKWMPCVYPRVDYRQAPWTAVVPRQSSQSIHTSREETFRRRFRIPYVFSWALLLVGNTAQVVSSFATTSSSEFDST